MALDNSSRLLAAVLGISLSVAFILGFYVGNSAAQNRSIPSIDSTSQSTLSAAPQLSTIPLDGPSRGSASANLILVEFSDFQCPYCKKFSSETYDLIDQNYIASGKLRHVFKHYPLQSIHVNAMDASIAAECANKQEKFWEYRDMLFERQDEWKNAEHVRDRLFHYSKELDLDQKDFETYLTSDESVQAVRADIQEGSRYGVSGTPTFFLGNDEKGYIGIAGAYSYETFKSIIDRSLG